MSYEVGMNIEDILTEEELVEYNNYRDALEQSNEQEDEAGFLEMFTEPYDEVRNGDRDRDLFPMDREVF